MRINRIHFAVCSFIMSLFLFGSDAHARYNVAYRSIASWIPVEDLRLDVSVWYPTKSSERLLDYGEWQFYAAKNAKPLQIIDKIKTKALKQMAATAKTASKEPLIAYKKFPLIVLSHDSTGTRHSYHTLAYELASQGYIVAAPTHVGDNMFDMSLTFTGQAFRHRVLQTSSTLDLLMENETLSQYVDPTKIVFLGFGGGSAAGFLLAGAELTTENWETYCFENEFLKKNTASDDEITSLINRDSQEPISMNLHTSLTNEQAPYLKPKKNPYCFGVLRDNISNMVDSIYVDLEQDQMKKSHYISAIKDRNRKYSVARSRINNLVRQQKRTSYKGNLLVKEPPFLMPFFPPLPARRGLYDKRFNYLIFVSPGYSLLFNAENLHSLQQKILLVGLGKETVNLPETQSAVFKKLLGRDVGHAIIENADTWALQAECPPKNALTELCDTVTDDEREDILEEMSELLVDFMPHMD